MAAPKGNQYAFGHGCGRPLLVNDQELEQMAYELVQWARKDDSLVYRDWLAMKGLYPSVVHDLKKRSEVFSKAIEYAKFMVGVRREKAAMKGDLTETMWAKVIHVYDPDMRDWEIEKRKADEDAEKAKMVPVRGGMTESSNS